jgi:regulator of replication initiation timing
MIQVNALKPIMSTKEIPRWKYKKNSFPNGQKSYWIRWKIHPDDVKFFSIPKKLIIKFNKELSNIDNENISVLNEWSVSKLSYSTNLPKLCEELNFFETLYDQEGELITALFRIKYMIDVDNLLYTMKNFDAFKDLVYKTIFTPSMKEKIKRMVEENYIDDIEAENDKNVLKNPDMLSIMQRKKKSLEFLNIHVKAMLMISFGIKILSFIINHFAVMRSINIQKNIEIFCRFYIDMFEVFDLPFNTFNKIYSYIESKLNSSINFNRAIFEQQEVEGLVH